MTRFDCLQQRLTIKDHFLADHAARCGQYSGPQNKNHDIVETDGYQQ